MMLYSITSTENERSVGLKSITFGPNCIMITNSSSKDELYLIQPYVGSLYNQEFFVKAYDQVFIRNGDNGWYEISENEAITDNIMSA